MRKVTRTPYNPYSIGECLDHASHGELALTYVNEDGETVTFSPDEITKDVLERFRDRVILAATGDELDNYEKWMLLKNNLDHFWTRRGAQYGRLMDAVLKTYDPISNYDRHESGGWTDTNILGARSGSDSGSDVYGAKSRTVTETPGVTDTITETPGVTTTRTDTPATTETVTETPGVTTTNTRTDNLSESVTETPGVTTTNTRTDNLSESVTETPRVATTTTSTPGVAMTTATDRAGDNSATYRAVERVTVSPDGVHSDVTVVEPTSGTNQTAKNNTGTQTNQETLSGTNQTAKTNTGTATNQETHEGTNQTSTVMSGMNTSVESFTGNNQSVHARTGSNTTGTSENAYTDTHSKTTTQASATDTNTRLFNEYHVFGNIGVTTSAQMLTGEIELRGALDLITHAIVEFVDLVSVYI